MARDKDDIGPHPVDRHVGRRVCETRINQGYNQSDLGRAINVSFQQVQKYENGANRISASKLFDIARFLKVDIGFFFQGYDLTAAAGVAEEGAGFKNDFPATRQTLEIARLSPRLPPRKQKLILEMIREMLGEISPDQDAD